MTGWATAGIVFMDGKVRRPALGSIAMPANYQQAARPTVNLSGTFPASLDSIQTVDDPGIVVGFVRNAAARTAQVKAYRRLYDKATAVGNVQGQDGSFSVLAVAANQLVTTGDPYGADAGTNPDVAQPNMRNHKHDSSVPRNWIAQHQHGLTHTATEAGQLVEVANGTDLSAFTVAFIAWGR